MWEDLAQATPDVHRHRSAAVPVLSVLLVLLCAAGAVGALELRSQHRRLARSQDSVAALRRAQTEDARASRATSSALKATQAQLAALAAQLTSTQNQLKTDEQQLRLAADALPPDLTKLAGQVSPSVVLVGCGNEIGSGFALDLAPSPGYASVVVTADHVVAACQGAGAAALTLTHEGVDLPVRLRAADPAADVALLDVAAALPALQAGAAPVTGQFVMAVGNPLGLTNNVTQGNVSQVNAGYFLNTAPISNGNSGGPLVDRRGQVLGIADAGYAASPDAPVVENLNSALRLSTLCRTLLTGRACTGLH